MTKSIKALEAENKALKRELATLRMQVATDMYLVFDKSNCKSGVDSHLAAKMFGVSEDELFDVLARAKCRLDDDGIVGEYAILNILVNDIDTPEAVAIRALVNQTVDRSAVLQEAIMDAEARHRFSREDRQ